MIVIDFDPDLTRSNHFGTESTRIWTLLTRILINSEIFPPILGGERGVKTIRPVLLKFQTITKKKVRKLHFDRIVEDLKISPTLFQTSNKIKKQGKIEN